MNLLVVDWDYFWEMIEPGHPKAAQNSQWTLYDWGHSEGGSMAAFMYDAIWYTRAASFLHRGLPLPDTSGLELTFWQRFRFHKNARIFYANSNVQAYDRRIARHIQRGDELWLFDAHHDCGGYRFNMEETMKREYVTCEDWMVPYGFKGVKLFMRYPKWRAYAMDAEPEPLIKHNPPILHMDRQVDDEQTVATTFHRVFVCKSGAWTPAWGDGKFEKFLLDCPVKGKRYSLDDVPPRVWDMAAAERDAAEIKQQLNRVAELNAQERTKETQSSC